MSFGEKLDKLIKEKGISRKEFSRLTGISLSSVSQYISGLHSPNKRTINTILKAFGLPDDYFSTAPAPEKIERLSVKECAALMHMSRDTLVLGLEKGVFPWGYAVIPEKGSGKKPVYFINKKKFMETEYPGGAG